VIPYFGLRQAGPQRAAHADFATGANLITRAARPRHDARPARRHQGFFDIRPTISTLAGDGARHPQTSSRQRHGRVADVGAWCARGLAKRINARSPSSTNGANAPANSMMNVICDVAGYTACWFDDLSILAALGERGVPCSNRRPRRSTPISARRVVGRAVARVANRAERAVITDSIQPTKGCSPRQIRVLPIASLIGEPSGAPRPGVGVESVRLTAIRAAEFSTKRFKYRRLPVEIPFHAVAYDGQITAHWPSMMPWRPESRRI